MKKKKIFLSILTIFILMISIFLYMNKDKFVYVGSVDVIEVDCSKKRQILSEVYESDQRIRKTNDLIKYGKEDNIMLGVRKACPAPLLCGAKRHPSRQPFHFVYGGWHCAYPPYNLCRV